MTRQDRSGYLNIHFESSDVWKYILRVQRLNDTTRKLLQNDRQTRYGAIYNGVLSLNSLSSVCICGVATGLQQEQLYNMLLHHVLLSIFRYSSCCKRLLRPRFLSQSRKICRTHRFLWHLDSGKRSRHQWGRRCSPAPFQTWKEGFLGHRLQNQRNTCC